VVEELYNTSLSTHRPSGAASHSLGFVLVQRILAVNQKIPKKDSPNWDFYQVLQGVPTLKSSD
jgi:hypothetical protein